MHHCAVCIDLRFITAWWGLVLCMYICTYVLASVVEVSSMYVVRDGGGSENLGGGGVVS